MLKYLYRTCPKCKDSLGVVVRDPPESKREVPIVGLSLPHENGAEIGGSRSVLSVR